MSVISEQEYITRIAALERQCATLAAEVDSQRVRERALSDAYLRLRQLIGRKAFDTPHAPTAEHVWTTTEIALAEIVAQVDRQEKVVKAALQWWTLSKYRPEHYLDHEQDLAVVVAEYEAQMARLAKESKS